jgi:hypothetical protein
MPEVQLVWMEKPGEEPIQVHPSTVAAHEAAGWKRQLEPVAAETPAEEPVAKKKK